MILTAKEFCSQTGFPLETIRRMCREGLLPHWQTGRVYRLSMEETLEALKRYQAQKKTMPPTYQEDIVKGLRDRARKFYGGVRK